MKSTCVSVPDPPNALALADRKLGMSADCQSLIKFSQLPLCLHTHKKIKENKKRTLRFFQEIFVPACLDLGFTFNQVSYCVVKLLLIVSCGRWVFKRRTIWNQLYIFSPLPKPLKVLMNHCVCAPQYVRQFSDNSVSHACMRTFFLGNRFPAWTIAVNRLSS